MIPTKCCTSSPEDESRTPRKKLNLNRLWKQFVNLPVCIENNDLVCIERKVLCCLNGDHIAWDNVLSPLPW